jgi:hypothetical protein
LDVPESFPDTISDELGLTTSHAESPSFPCVRSSFQLERILDDPNASTKTPKFGEKCYIVAHIQVWGKKVKISFRFDFLDVSFNRQQISHT